MRGRIGIAPGAPEEGGADLGAGGLAEGFDLLLCRETLEGLALFEQLAGDFGMAVGARCLADGFAIVIQAQPFQTVEDGLRRLGGRAGAVGILDPQKEFSATAPRVEPVEQRRPCPADMQKAGGRRGKSGDDRLGHVGQGPFWINLSVTVLGDIERISFP